MGPDRKTKFSYMQQTANMIIMVSLTMMVMIVTMTVNTLIEILMETM